MRLVAVVRVRMCMCVPRNGPSFVAVPPSALTLTLSTNRLRPISLPLSTRSLPLYSASESVTRSANRVTPAGT